MASEGHFGIGVYECLSINLADTLQNTDIENALGTRIARMVRFYLPSYFIIVLFSSPVPLPESRWEEYPLWQFFLQEHPGVS